MNRFLSLLLLCSAFLSCQGVQDSTGKVLSNAGSVIDSGSSKLVTSPSPSNGEGAVESSARQVLENAGEVVQSGTSKIVTTPAK